MVVQDGKTSGGNGKFNFIHLDDLRQTFLRKNSPRPISNSFGKLLLLRGGGYLTDGSLAAKRTN